MKLSELDNYLKKLLAIEEISDISINGIQIGDEEQEIKSIALAVDANRKTIAKAVELKADMLLVHHGIFWGKPFAIKQEEYRKLKHFFLNPMSLYAVHLPLDSHDPLGNNCQLAKHFELLELEPFGNYGGFSIGNQGKNPGYSLEKIIKISESLSATCKSIIHKPERIEKIAIVSGKGGTGIIDEAYHTRIDILITGEIEHSLYNLIQDREMNVISLGHYESEKYGVLALGEHLQKEFGIAVTFIEEPTGF